MKIRVAKTAGFCWGVRRAIDRVLELRAKTAGEIQTLGPLIHNPQALEMLEQKGIDIAESLEDLSGGTVVIRTHGISPAVRSELQERNLTICDGTCPRVAHIQSLIRRCGRVGKQVVIAGDPGHAEVVGLMGCAGEAGHVVPRAADVATLPELDRVALVAQTTFGEAEFAEIVDAVRERFPGVEVFDTICDSTHNRQREVRELAGDCDVIVVIGGRGSANTRRLAELAGSLGAPTSHVESDDELQPQMFDGARTVGVTAGASTPHWMIQRVVERIEAIGKSRKKRWLAAACRFLVASNIFVAVGAGQLCLLTVALLGIEPRPQYGLIAGCYIFAMHLLSHFADPNAVGHNEPLRFRLYRRYKLPMAAAGAISAAVAVGVAFSLAPLTGMLLLVATAMGLLYSVRVVPRRWALTLRFRRLKDIPSSKDLFVAIAWSAVTVLVPALHRGHHPLSAAVLSPLIGVFVLVYARSVLFDMREIRGDRLVGKETLPTILGVGRTQLWLASVVAAAALLYLTAGLSGLASPASLMVVPLLIYIGIAQLLFHFELIGIGLATEAVVDGNFYLAGLLAAAWMALA